MSSISGLKPFPGLTGYCVAKAALDQFTKCSALDLAPKKIRVRQRSRYGEQLIISSKIVIFFFNPKVNSINPAIIRTPIFQKAGLTQDGIERLLEQARSTYPVGRIGEVSDTSAAIAFLADNEISSFLTGILLPVDGIYRA